MVKHVSFISKKKLKNIMSIWSILIQKKVPNKQYFIGWRKKYKNQDKKLFVCTLSS